MGQVMRKAVQVDDQHYCSVRERLAQLEVSTAESRPTAHILTPSITLILEIQNTKVSQTYSTVKKS